MIKELSLIKVVEKNETTFNK